MRAFVSAAACFALVVEAKDWSTDLKRARQWTPRAEYRGYGTLASANAKLNKHLAGKKGIKLKACEEFDTQGVRDVLSALLPRVSMELKAIYSEKDGRAGKYDTLPQMQLHWQHAPADDLRVRDAHCHEAVMWFVHHSASEEQEKVMKTEMHYMYLNEDFKAAIPVVIHRYPCVSLHHSNSISWKTMKRDLVPCNIQIF